jgi:uncharacterized membrane protein
MKQGRDWLLSELPELQRQGVLDADTAERLRGHYATTATQETTGVAWGRLLSAILGAALVGLGVILLVAHNWDGWPRGMRVAVSFAPLLIGQLACVWAVTKARGNVAWAEGAAIFTLTSFAAALALVGQLYHFPADLDRFLLTCVLVALPLVYLLNASLTAIVCAAGIMLWTAAGAERASALWVTLLFATLLPHLLLARSRHPEGLRATLLLAWLVPLFGLAVLISLADTPRLAWLWLAQGAAVLWLLDRRSHGLSWRQPLTSYGTLGVVGTALIATYPGFWTARHFGLLGHFGAGISLEGGLLTAILGLLMLLLAVRAGRSRDWLGLAGIVPAVLLWLSLALDTTRVAVLLALLVNAYVLLLGLAVIRDGLRRRSLRAANGGLMLIGLLVLLRFFDGDWSFTVRGVAFVLIGLAFLGANLWLKRRVREVAP